MIPAVPTVLLVEDNAADARLLQEMVAGTGEHDLALESCQRLADAIDRVDRFQIDCVLLDLSLPDTSGLDGVDELRSRFPEMPIVILTGLDDQDVAVDALHAGVQDYLVKGRIEGDGVKRAVRYAIERKLADEELARSKRQNQQILDSAGEGICGLDADGRITFINPAAAELLGHRRESLVGKSLHDAVHGGADDEHFHEPELCVVHEALGDGLARSGDDLFWGAHRGSFPVDYVATPIRSGAVIEGAVVTFRDITERKRAQAQLQYLADHDVLTGLFNRRRFGEELTRQIRNTGGVGAGSALLVFDIDNFKYVNDALGHPAGDELIRTLASKLRSRIRRTDVIGRLGGDEFAVLLGGVDAKRATELAEEMLELVRSHRVVARDKPVRATTSIGMTMFDRSDLTAEQLLMEADVALYEAKAGGRDRCVMFTRNPLSQANGRPGSVWTDRIKRALDDDLFAVYAQPIVALDTAAANGIDRYELLVRMREEDGRAVLPGAFLPVAERFGLVGMIDAWMIRRAVKLVESAQVAGRRIMLGVNLSGHSISGQELAEVIEEELTSSPIDPSSLVFEITETAAISNMEEACKLASRIRRWGCRFAVDDFGAGFGSFYYLKYLPVDYLKIDGEFIRHLDRSDIDQRMVRAMVQIARAVGMQTIAEFVESAETLELLRECGVDFVQGYHLARPAPVDEVLALPSWSRC